MSFMHICRPIAARILGGSSIRFWNDLELTDLQLRGVAEVGSQLSHDDIEGSSRSIDDRGVCSGSSKRS